MNTLNDKIYKADRVLVTVPIGILKFDKISFKPELNKNKKDVLLKSMNVQTTDYNNIYHSEKNQNNLAVTV